MHADQKLPTTGPLPSHHLYCVGQNHWVLDLLVEAWQDAMAVLLPVDCAGCDAPDRALCSACRLLLQSTEHRLLGSRVLADSTRVVSALRYEGQVRRMILGLKEQGRTDLVRFLAPPLRAAIEGAAFGADPGVELCAVPSSRQAQRRRGYRPVNALIRGAGFRCTPMLGYSAQTEQQKTLDLAHRGVNLRGAIAAHPSVANRSFVLVDDVVTSGATLLESARALRSAGARVVAAATLAFTPRYDGHQQRVLGFDA